MPGAKHTSPPAKVQRFKGGQIATDPSKLSSRMDAGMSNLAPGPKPYGKGSKYAATIHTTSKREGGHEGWHSI